MQVVQILDTNCVQIKSSILERATQISDETTCMGFDAPHSSYYLLGEVPEEVQMILLESALDRQVLEHLLDLQRSATSVSKGAFSIQGHDLV